MSKTNQPGKTTTAKTQAGVHSGQGIRYGDAWKVDALGVVALAALSGLAYWLGVSPMLERHARIEARQIELNTAHRKSAETLHQLADIKTQLVATRKELSAAPLRLEPASLLNHRLALVTDLVSQSGAGLDDIQPGRPGGGSRFDMLPIRVAGTATYGTFTALLHRLRADFPDIGVSSLDVAGNPQDPTGSAKFGLDLIWYTQPAKAAPSAAEKDPVNGVK